MGEKETIGRLEQMAVLSLPSFCFPLLLLIPLSHTFPLLNNALAALADVRSTAKYAEQ